MILDSRIKEGKKPLSCLDTDEAKQFIGKEGYFTDCLAVFTDVRRYEKKWMLKAIDEKAQSCFKDADGVRWDYFLPAEWVKEPETPKFIPYTLDTWQHEFEPGDVITFRGKVGTDREGRQYKCIYAGWRFIGSDITQDANVTVALGFRAFTFSELFDLYEINRDGNWEPFGKKLNGG